LGKQIKAFTLKLNMNSLVIDKNQIWQSKINKEISYPEEGNDLCFAIEENSFWFKHRNNAILEVIKRFDFNGNFADVGGGNGYQAKFLSESLQKEIYLIEPGYSGCLNARKRGIKEVYNLFFEDFPFTDKNIAGVGLFDVIEHIEDDVTFLDKLTAYLPKGSKIFITVPAHQSLWSKIDDESGHYRRYNQKMIADLASKCGLKVLLNSYYFWYLSIPIYLLRVLPEKLFGVSKKSSIEKEQNNHKSSTLVDRILNWMNDWELKRLKTTQLNFGASSIVVLEK
jgi:hypothetical protein